MPELTDVLRVVTGDPEPAAMLVCLLDIAQRLAVGPASVRLGARPEALVL